jgi:3-phenylpropionate/trans-cinnamate dioxygenase ferredoxin reductase subunit
MGCVATVIEAASRLCARAASEQLSGYLLDLHLANGVAVHLNTSVTSVEERNDRLVCTLSDGGMVTTDAILVGIGLIPNVELAEAAGLPTDNGILVDASGRTADPLIYAVGDVAHRHSDLAGRPRRLESWSNAQNEGIAVGHTIIGLDRPAEEIPWFWSDQHGVNIQILGIPADDDATVTRSDDASQTVFHLAGDRLSGVHACNDPMAIKVAKRLIARDMPVDAARLVDLTVPLKSLLKG